MVVVNVDDGEKKTFQADVENLFTRFGIRSVALVLNAGGIFLSDWRGGMEITLNDHPASIYTDVPDGATIVVKKPASACPCPLCG